MVNSRQEQASIGNIDMLCNNASNQKKQMINSNKNVIEDIGKSTEASYESRQKTQYKNETTMKEVIGSWNNPMYHGHNEIVQTSGFSR